MCRVIAIANQKGGVGKTTTTSNLGIGLVKNGKKVLLIDADAQGSLTASLGYQQPDKLEVTLATIMEHIVNEKVFEPYEGILHHDEGVDLLPANIELSGTAVSLVNIMSRETILREYVNYVSDFYDYILIDCTPSLNDNHKCTCLCRFRIDSGAGGISARKRSGAAYPDYRKGKASDQSEAGD